MTFPLQLLNLAEEIGLPVPESEPEPEVSILEVVTETEPEVPEVYKWLAIINIILWILFFMGAFDD